jgi:chromatin segregation and condensation protein Rec8/ScpA/Scc1 (kleisin family)
VNNRAFSIINAVGCLALVGFILFQWLVGYGLEREIHVEKSSRINETNARVEAERRAKILESDIAGLKTSIDLIRADVDLKEKERAEAVKEAEALRAVVQQANDQMKTMNDAIVARDEAIRARDAHLKALGETLVATRKRLNEAVEKLKEAAKGR